MRSKLINVNQIRCTSFSLWIDCELKQFNLVWTFRLSRIFCEIRWKYQRHRISLVPVRTNFNGQRTMKTFSVVQLSFVPHRNGVRAMFWQWFDHFYVHIFVFFSSLGNQKPCELHSQSDQNTPNTIFRGRYFVPALYFVWCFFFLLQINKLVKSSILYFGVSETTVSHAKCSRFVYLCYFEPRNVPIQA